jgi:hypothetical protein
MLVGKPEGNRPLRRYRNTWGNNIKMDLGEIGLNGMEFNNLAQGGDQWKAPVNSVMNFQVS